MDFTERLDWRCPGSGRAGAGRDGPASRSRVCARVRLAGGNASAAATAQAQPAGVSTSLAHEQPHDSSRRRFSGSAGTSTSASWLSSCPGRACYSLIMMRHDPSAAPATPKGGRPRDVCPSRGSLRQRRYMVRKACRLTIAYAQLSPMRSSPCAPSATSALMRRRTPPALASLWGACWIGLGGRRAGRGQGDPRALSPFVTDAATPGAVPTNTLSMTRRDLGFFCLAW